MIKFAIGIAAVSYTSPTQTANGAAANLNKNVIKIHDVPIETINSELDERDANNVSIFAVIPIYVRSTIFE